MSNIFSTQDQFNNNAEHYVNSFTHSSGESLIQIKNWVSKLENINTAIDLATGPGFTAFEISKLSKHVIATDISIKMLDQAKKIASERNITNIDFEEIDAMNISYKDNFFDLVSCRTAPHHFININKFLSEVKRILKNQGYFILADTSTSINEEPRTWQQKVEKIRDKTHIESLDIHSWARKIESYGFNIIDKTVTQVPMTFNKWVQRSGTSKKDIEILFNLFKNASSKSIKEFKIKEINNIDFSFSWPCFVSISNINKEK
ncbi:MAG: methyltransferase domain-containing protein [Dehalococcoidales bacterium]|jgi:ubiquinone/menaquinone biosynthesis C-methylase UbiE|nr:methyltransferase domain-containing protein [Dehalococcoidales bacterium]